MNWKEWHKSRSDIADITGSHPAVFGWEISKLGKSHQNIDSVDFEHMKDWIKEACKMGGVNTISWHMDNFVTGNHSWDVGENVVATILPGGEYHEAYKNKLDIFTDFVNDLKTGFLFKKRICFTNTRVRGFGGSSLTVHLKNTSNSGNSLSGT